MVQLSELEMFALAAVAQLRGDAYGVTIREEIERRTGRSVSIGSLYKALHRLENQGLTGVTVGEPEAVRGGRAKKYVRLSPAGRRALSESIRAIGRMVEGLDREWRPT